MKIFNRNISRLRIFLFFFEFFVILGILCLIVFLRFLYQEGAYNYWLFNLPQCLGHALIIVLVCQGSMYLNELYDYKIAQSRREFFIRLFQSLGVACITLGMLYLFFEEIYIGQANFLIALPTIILAVFGCRQLYHNLLRTTTLAEKVMILGSAEIAKDIMEEINDVKDSGYEITAVASEKGREDLSFSGVSSAKNIVPLEDFSNEVWKKGINRIIVAIADRRGKLPFDDLLTCRFKGIQVQEATSFYETLTGKILVKDLRPSWFIFSEGFRKSKLTLKMKRTTDIIMAIGLLSFTFPIMLITALLIKVGSKGPAIYKQDRVGEGWHDYTLYKFRSMREDAEAGGAKWAEENDPRITKVGRVIRKYRIDELPQLFNVLKGDMSFVGPRPERRHFIKDLAKEIPFYPQRLFVKPGLTGWAQVKFHYGASRDDTMEKLQYDLYYIKNMSFLFDLSIIFDTVRVVLAGAGAR